MQKKYIFDQYLYIYTDKEYRLILINLISMIGMNCGRNFLSLVH